MALIFEGRAVPDEAPEDYEVAPAPCVFCGKAVSHINDGGTAFVAGAIVAGEVRHFLYCNAGGCSGSRPDVDWGRLWTCGDCHVDCLVDECHECRQPRHLVDRDILAPYERGVDSKARRYAVVRGDDPPDLPDGVRVVAEYGYAGTLGSSRWAVAKFSCDGAAEAYRDHAPYDVELYERRRTAVAAAEAAHDALWDRASRAAPAPDAADATTPARVNLLETDEMPEAGVFYFQHGVCLRSLHSQRYWLGVLRENAPPNMAGAYDGTEGLCELLDAMLAQYTTDEKGV